MTRRNHRRKHPARRILAALALAFCTELAIWILVSTAVFARFGGLGPVTMGVRIIEHNGFFWCVEVIRSVGVPPSVLSRCFPTREAAEGWLIATRDSIQAAKAAGTAPSITLVHDQRATPPDWTRFRSLDPDAYAEPGWLLEPFARFEVWERAVGWPWPMARRQRITAIRFKEETRTEELFVDSSQGLLSLRDDINLPIGMMWGGLTLNLLTIGAAWWCGLSAASSTRRWIRRRRGRCEWCKYDLSASPADALCPECGRSSARVADERSD